MNKDCTQEFLDLKNPLIIRTILENLNRSALMLFLQQRGFSINNLKKMPKTKLVDEIIKTFNLPAPGCNTAKKEFYYNVLRQKPDASVCLSNTDRTLIQDLVNTSDIQKRRDIIKMLDAKTIYMLSSYFDIPNAENIDIEELRQIFVRLSSKKRTPLPQRAAASPQACGSPLVSPSVVAPSVLTGFLNARTIADRRDILKKLNRQQLFVLATYFKISDYKTQTRENIIKKLLYNIPPPNVTSIKTDGVSLTQKIINSFSNAHTVSTRKDYLNTLDKQSLLILAEHYDIPNNKSKEEIFNDLVYKTPTTPVVSNISSPCNIPKNMQFFSEREKKIVKSFINATTIGSKKKLLNSLSKEDLLVLAQKLNIYGASALNIAQLREQIFKNGTNNGMSLTQMFELAQNEEQRKKILNFVDKRGLMMLAKKYNIININKMPAEYIRNSLIGLPYLNYKPSNYNNACKITANKQLIISPLSTSSGCQSTSASCPGDKLLTPTSLRNKARADLFPPPPLFTSSGCQASLEQTEAPVLCQRDASTSVLPKSSLLRQPSPYVAKRPQPLAEVIETVPTSFTRTPLKIKNIESPSPSRSTSSVYVSPQMSGRSKSSSIRLTSNQLASLVGPTELGRNSSCSIDDTTPLSVVEISNISNSPQKNLSGLHNILDNLQTRFGQTREEAIRNSDLIKFSIKNYLKNNPLYTDDGELITIDHTSFFSNGVLLAGDEGEQKKQVEELKRRVPYINWTAISGIVSVGLVHLYSWWLYNMAGDVFGPSTTGFNVTNEYCPQPIQPQTFGFNYYSDECGGYDNMCSTTINPYLYS
jgi:hypothetical protein